MRVLAATLRSLLLVALAASCEDHPSPAPRIDAAVAPDGPVAAADGPAADADPVADAEPTSDAGPDADPAPDAIASPDATLLVDCPPATRPAAPDAYTSIEDLHDAALRAALLGRVEGHTALSYTAAKQALFGAGGIDVHGGTIECAYTGQLYTPSQLDASGGFNTEHSWPQSEFPSGFGETPRSDMHHLFPTEQVVNSRRGNLPFGDTDCDATSCSWQGYGSELGPRIGGSELVFEVRPRRRGEIARAHFYFAVRYQEPIPAAEEATLRRWHHCDPPDDEERGRTAAIEAAQGNRNPFVDRPDLAEQIADF